LAETPGAVPGPAIGVIVECNAATRLQKIQESMADLGSQAVFTRVSIYLTCSVG